jgi:hypothetical protein
MAAHRPETHTHHVLSLCTSRRWLGYQRVPLRSWSGLRDVSHWKPLLVRAVIAIWTSSVIQFPCLATDRGRACSNFFGMEACSLAHWAYQLAGSEGSTLYCFGNRRCADRQRDLVVYKGKLMGEDILPDLGIQEALTGNQGIHGTQEHSHIFPAQL